MVHKSLCRSSSATFDHRTNLDQVWQVRIFPRMELHRHFTLRFILCILFIRRLQSIKLTWKRIQRIPPRNQVGFAYFVYYKAYATHKTLWCFRASCLDDFNVCSRADSTSNSYIYGLFYFLANSDCFKHDAILNKFIIWSTRT